MDNLRREAVDILFVDCALAEQLTFQIHVAHMTVEQLGINLT